MCKSMKYEAFLRKAFKLNNKGDDPAGIAQADNYACCYTPEAFNEIKAAVSYSIVALNSKHRNEKIFKNKDIYTKMDKFLESALEAKTLSELGLIIQEYNDFEEEIEVEENESVM